MTGVLFNIFACLVAGISGLMVFSRISKLRRSPVPTDYGRGLDYFLLAFGVLWLLVALRLTFFWFSEGLGWEFFASWDQFIWGWIVGPLTYIHVLPLFFFFAWSFFGYQSHWYRIFVSIFAFTTLVTVVSLFIWEFELQEASNWGSKYDAHIYTHLLFTVTMYLPVVVCIVIDLIRRYKRWARNGSLTELQLAGFNGGILFFAAIAVSDGLALAEGPFMIPVRMGIMVSALIIYYFATLQEEHYYRDLSNSG